MARTAGESYVTVTHGMRGWFAVLMHWNTDLGGFWEPYVTDSSSFKTREAAIPAAKAIAEAEGVEFHL